MWLTLYIPRFLLQVLGIVDYGVYVLVGSIAVIFSFISESFLVASQRYIATAIAGRDIKLLQNVFTTCVNSHRLIALILFICSEIIGTILINYQLEIPTDRLYAANIAFQASVVSCVFTILSLPYRAAIVAYEKMAFFAFDGIILTIFKLLILLAVYFSGGDHLVTYSVLFGFVGVLQLVINKMYCIYKLEGIKYKKYWNKNEFKGIFCFIGWNILKQGAYTMFIQGAGLMFNMFGGIAVNAAYGVAQQVYGACMTFMHNVQAAFYPQIIKECAVKEYNSLFQLISRSARFSNYILILLILPILLNIDFVLHSWLGNVPNYANSLSVVIILSCFLEAYVEPLNTTILAEGKVKKYQITISFVWIVSTFILFVCLTIRLAFYIALSVRVVAQLVIMLYCNFYLKKSINFTWLSYLKNDVLFSLILLFICYIIPYLFLKFYPLTGITQLFSTTLVAWTIWFAMVVKFGLRRDELLGIKRYLLSLYKKHKN